MTNWNPHTRLATLLPVLLVMLLALANGATQSVLISCKGPLVSCDPPDLALLMPSEEVVEIEKDIDLVPPDDLEGRHAMISDRYTGRLRWAFLVSVHALFGVFSLLIAAWVIVRSLGSWTKRTKATYVLWSVFAALVAAFVLLINWPSFNMASSGHILRNVISREVVGNYAGVENVMTVANAVAYVAALALVISSSAVLSMQRLPNTRSPASAGGQDDPPPSAKDRLALVSHQARVLRIVFYTSTVLLVTGVLRMHSVMHWATAFFDSALEPAIAGFADIVVGVNGAFFSMVLAAVYFPAEYVLRLRARAHFQDVGLEPSEWLAQNHLLAGWGASWTKIATLLGPLLAGPLGDLVGDLVG